MVPTNPDQPWPPSVGELLPRGAETVGVRHKLVGYSLDPANEIGGPKARGFQRILGITIDDVDYLADAIMAGVLRTPISSMREKPPYGVNCVVELDIRGIGAHNRRVANVRTVWQLAEPGGQPRLVSAYPKP